MLSQSFLIRMRVQALSLPPCCVCFVLNTRVLSANRVDFGLFVLFHIISNFIPPGCAFGIGQSAATHLDIALEKLLHVTKVGVHRVLWKYFVVQHGLIPHQQGLFGLGLFLIITVYSIIITVYSSSILSHYSCRTTWSRSPQAGSARTRAPLTSSRSRPLPCWLMGGGGGIWIKQQNVAY